MKPSEALKLARASFIVRGGFICHRLREINDPGAIKAIKHIGRLLYPDYTYGAWLAANDPVWYKKYTTTRDAHIKARLLWIDDMIKYWEAKGE